jgi:hypothetical protein
MFVCYVDESGYTGTGHSHSQPYLVVSGVMANTYNMHRTQTDFAEILNDFREITGREFEEVKAGQLYRGQGIWQGVQPARRNQAYQRVLEWFADRGHHVTFSAIGSRAFNERRCDSPIIQTLGAPYVAAALNIGLAVQKRNMQQKKNKGKTLLIFDQQDQFAQQVAELLSNPPDWTDDYYGYAAGERLNQIVDTAYFVKSHHASLIQIADFVAFCLRRHAEIQEGDEGERFSGEGNLIAAWVNLVKPRLFARSQRLPTGGTLGPLYRDLCPPALHDL